MKTTLNVTDKILAEAMAASKSRTKTEAALAYILESEKTYR